MVDVVTSLGFPTRKYEYCFAAKAGNVAQSNKSSRDFFTAALLEGRHSNPGRNELQGDGRRGGSRRHPERSRSSGGARDLPRPEIRRRSAASHSACKGFALSPNSKPRFPKLSFDPSTGSSELSSLNAPGNLRKHFSRGLCTLILLTAM